MSITLANIKQRLNDFRIDFTSGTVDTDQEGLRAINSAIEHIFVKHEFDTTLDTEVIRHYPCQLEYPEPDNFYCISSLYPFGTGLDQFRLRSPKNLRHQALNGSHVAMVGVDSNRNRKLIIHWPQNNASYTDLCQTVSLDDGTLAWTESGDLDDLALEPSLTSDTSDHLAFTIVPSAGTATLVGTFSADKDYSSYAKLGKVFITARLAGCSYLDGIQLQFEDSDGDSLLSALATTLADGTPLEDGEGKILGFDVSTMTETGTFDWTKVRIVRVIFDEDVASFLTEQGPYAVYEMVISNPKLLELNHYTYSMVYEPDTETYSFKFDGTSDSDQLNLHDEALDMIAEGAAWRLLEQMGRNELADKYRGYFYSSLKSYQAKYPSLRKEPEGPSMTPYRSLKSGYGFKQ